MKKIFIDPELKRIELNLRENIAASGYELVLTTFLDSNICMIVSTNIPYGTTTTREEVESCIYMVAPRMGGTVAIPLSEMREFIR